VSRHGVDHSKRFADVAQAIGKLPACTLVLYRNGRDLSARPLRDCRARLEDVVADSELVFAVRRQVPDGLEAWKQVVQRGYEG
jgi:hypothetical protein